MPGRAWFLRRRWDLGQQAGKFAAAADDPLAPAPLPDALPLMPLLEPDAVPPLMEPLPVVEPAAPEPEPDIALFN